MKLTFLHLLSIIAVFQLAFIAVFLLTTSRGNRLSNRLLGLFFLALALSLGDGLMILAGTYDSAVQLAFIGNNLSFLFGPLLYVYTQSVIYKGYRLSRNAFWHVIPFLLVSAFTIYFYHLQPLAIKKHILQTARHPSATPVPVYVFSLLGYGQLFTYLLLSHRLIRQYRRAIREKFSKIEGLNLSWLTFMIGAFALAMTMSLVQSFIPLTPFRGYNELTLAICIVSLFFFINRVIMRALHQSEIFTGIDEQQAKEPPRKYAGSSLEEADSQRHLERLKEMMQTEKPYLDPDLSLDALAARLNLPAKTLSQVINGLLHQSFFDFVNRYRIEEAKRLLSYPKDKKVTVLEVMYQVGFNSKSSFNTEFKRLTNTTPSEFKKAHS